MPEIICPDPPPITRLEEHQLDQHSLLNIFNILLGKVYILGTTVAREPELFEETLHITRDFMGRLMDPDKVESILLGLDSFRDQYFASLDRILANFPESLSDRKVEQSLDNLENIFEVLKKRIGEMRKRIDCGDTWIRHSIEELKGNFAQVFKAIEKNSMGRYRIVTNLARQGDQDYLVGFEIESHRDEVIAMPPVFQDTMRDLMANARKYTAPGGHISAGIFADDQRIHFVVEDNGVGIPENELPRVTEWGYRARNVTDRPTHGGGFGLTKAIYVVKRFHGNMRIQSTLDKGTRISIELPVNGHPVER